MVMVKRVESQLRSKSRGPSKRAALSKKSPAKDSALSCDQRLVHLADVKSARRGLISEALAQQLAENLSLLGDPTRLRIISALSSHELCVCDIAATIGISESAVSHQLRVLRSLDLVLHRKEGRIAYYRLINPQLSELHLKLQSLFQVVRQRSEAVLG
jgi:ArsR family transcriptional regulator, lead/cadmium/zinc/bismuth-responsive transcriptional repressor